MTIVLSHRHKPILFKSSKGKFVGLIFYKTRIIYTIKFIKILVLKFAYLSSISSPRWLSLILKMKIYVTLQNLELLEQ